MKRSAPPTPDPGSKKWVAFERAQDRAMRLHFRAEKLMRQAEELLLIQNEEIRSKGDQELLELSLGRLATFYGIWGRNRKAEQALYEREKMFPKSLQAKFSTAHYFLWNLRHYDWALRKLAQIKPSRISGRYDLDTYYNALNLKGIALVSLGRRQRAEKLMDELAEFTKANLGRILFFFDLSFAEMLIEKGWAIDSCRDYLRTLRTRKQVKHDQRKTIELLRKISAR